MILDKLSMTQSDIQSFVNGFVATLRLPAPDVRIAEDIASRVLTLPTYYGLPLEDVKAVAENVLEIVR